MKCPYCASNDTFVVDSRKRVRDYTYRRRKCSECKKRFASYEIPEEEYDRLSRIDEISKQIGKLRASLNEIEI